MKIKWIRTAVLLALLLAILVSPVPRSVRAQTAQGDNSPETASSYKQCPNAPFVVPSEYVHASYWKTTFPPGYTTPHVGVDFTGRTTDPNKARQPTSRACPGDGTWDLGVPGEAPVYAAYDGTVDFVWAPGGVPINVWIKHENVPVNGRIEPIVCTYYEHMKNAATSESTIFPQFQVVGAEVRKGEQIGWIGNGSGSTGSTFAHLHFGVAIGLSYGHCNRLLTDPTWTDPSPFLGFNVSYDNGASSFCYNVDCPPVVPTPPTADAGGPYAANEGQTVILDASGSSDPDGMIVSYEWDLDGDGEYDDATGQIPSWTWGDDYAGNIGLKVTDDDGAIGTDTTTVTISNVAPTVEAGPDQIVFRNDVVALSGAWTDPAGSLDELYSWTWDVTGDGITDNSGSASYGSVVPASTSFATEGTYPLTFAVTDKDGGAGSDSIVVEVLNRPPDCSVAAPSIETIWPPNHKFVLVNVLGVTDPENDPVSITIDSIWQDEPVDTVGDGRFSPDGQGVGTDTAQVRAERVGTKKAPGNGRVCHIGFTADDGHGGSCSSEVLIGVPHDQRGTPPVDDGALYDSTALAP